MENETAAPQGDTGSAAGATPSFIESLGETYAGNEALKGIENVQSLTDRYLETQAKLSETSKLIPQVPTKPEEYKLEGKIEGLDESFSAEFQKTAHELGLTNAQYEGLLKLEAQATLAESKAYEESKGAAKAELVKEYGDKFDAKLEAAQGVLKAFGFTEKFATMDSVDASMANHPDFFRFLVAVSEKITTDSINGSVNGGSQATKESWAEKMNLTQYDKKG